MPDPVVFLSITGVFLVMCSRSKLFPSRVEDTFSGMPLTMVSTKPLAVFRSPKSVLYSLSTGPVSVLRITRTPGKEGTLWKTYPIISSMSELVLEILTKASKSPNIVLLNGVILLLTDKVGVAGIGRALWTRSGVLRVTSPNSRKL